MNLDKHHLAVHLIPCAAIALMGALTAPAFAQNEVQLIVKHLKTSQDFTLKVADQMPEADYAFKLTPPQMSFAEKQTNNRRGFVAMAGTYAELAA